MASKELQLNSSMHKLQASNAKGYSYIALCTDYMPIMFKLFEFYSHYFLSVSSGSDPGGYLQYT